MRIALRSDAAGRAAIELVGPAELGWYRNGIPVSVEADPGVSSVRWIAGGFGLSTSADRAGRFAARLVFQNLGWRVITAEALDRAGATLGAASVLVRVVPGDDVRGPVSVRILTPAPGARTWTNGDLLKVAGSDSIVRVRYGADGYVMGESIERSRGFPLAYRFSQLGERLIEVRGYDASGAVRGTDRVRVEVRPEVGR